MQLFQNHTLDVTVCVPEQKHRHLATVRSLQKRCFGDLWMHNLRGHFINTVLGGYTNSLNTLFPFSSHPWKEVLHSAEQGLTKSMKPIYASPQHFSYQTVSLW